MIPGAEVAWLFVITPPPPLFFTHTHIHTNSPASFFNHEHTLIQKYLLVNNFGPFSSDAEYTFHSFNLYSGNVYLSVLFHYLYHALSLSLSVSVCLSVCLSLSLSLSVSLSLSIYLSLSTISSFTARSCL